MDNFNKEQQLYCKYCNKECKSLNSLKQHECRCKYNPNKISHSGGWPKGKGRGISYTKNTICMTNGINEKYIDPCLINDFIKLGWYKGRCERIKNNYNNTGKSKTIELEKIRRQKISNSMKNNPLCGGYRKGSGRGHEGWYNNIFCDSSWELAFLVYHIENNLYIERCKEKREYIWKDQKHTYIPDFITDKGIIEIKGFKTEQSEAKRLQNPDIIYLYEKDIQYCLDYTINKYGNKFWEILYENR